jgi:alkanesulfonate monooxygenase
MLVSHRTGFISPTMAARLMATTDNFCGGRLKVHVLVGGNDEGQRRDGDWLGHDERYARADEYLEILRQVWGGGGSRLSIDLCAKHCERFMFWGEPVATLAERIKQIRMAAKGYGRGLRSCRNPRAPRGCARSPKSVKSTISVSGRESPGRRRRLGTPRRSSGRPSGPAIPDRLIVPLACERTRGRSDARNNG